MSEPVRILLLGPPTITYADAPLKMSRRTHRALLYYLALQQQAVPRSILISLLWPDASSDTTGRSRLRETLARIRKELPAEDLLDADREVVSLRADGFEIDVRRFQTLAEESERLLVQLLPSTPLLESLHNKMTEAVQLWRSPHFMEGVDLPDSEDLETLLRSTRQQMESQYLRLLERLAENDTILGNFSAAAGWLQKALACDPYNDSLHARLISLLEQQNRWSEALSHIQHIQKSAEDGLFDLTPALERLALRVRERAALAPDNPDARWPGRPSVRVPMTGRANELKLAQLAWQRSAPLLIFGEAGSGKTRLIQELIPTLNPSPRLLAAAARPLEGHLPFQPLMDMLRQEVTAAEWRELSRSHQSALALMLPELAQSLGVQPPASAAALSRPLLFDALHQLLLLMRSRQRLLVVLDDAQWSDKTTLEALAYLMERRFFGPQASLILAARIEESNPALSVFISYLPQSPTPAQVQLNRLDPDSITEIVRFVLGFTPSPALSQRVSHETGGNPFFLLETLRALLEYNIRPEQIEAAEHLPVAGSIQALLRERTRLLSDHARQVLHLAAVIGSQVSFQLLQRTANGSLEQLVDSLEELEHAHLLQADPQIPPNGGYSFIHEKIRELVLMELGLARRQMTHLRVARVLESQPNIQAAVLAGHFEQAGEAHKAFQYWFKAAQHARRLYSNAEAGAAFQSAERILLDRGAAIPDEDVYQVCIAWGTLAFDTANAPLAQHIFNELLQIGAARGSKLLVAAGHLGLASLNDLLDQFEEGLRHVEEARVFLGELNRPELEILLRYRLAGFLGLQNRIPEAIKELEQAHKLLSLQSSSYGEALQAGLEYRLAFAILLNGQPARSIALAEDLLSRSRAALDQASTARALAVLSMINHSIGHDQISLIQAQDGMHIAEAIHNARLFSTFLVHQAQAELSLGLLDDALAHARQALESANQFKLPRIASQAYRILGDIELLLKHDTTAEEMYRAGLAASPPGYQTATIMPRLACLMVQTGRIEEGQALAQEGVDFCRRSGMLVYGLDILAGRACILLTLGQYEESAHLAEENAMKAASMGISRIRGISYWQIARSVLFTGRVDEARQKALAAAQIFRELQHPIMELQALNVVAEAEKHLHSPSETSVTRAQALLSHLAQQTCSPELQHLVKQLNFQFCAFNQQL